MDTKMKFDTVTRVEVIDNNGILYVEGFGKAYK